MNKIDLPSATGHTENDGLLNRFQTVEISALTGEGIDRLKKAIKDCILEDGALEVTTSHAIPNLRHREALKAARECFENAVINAQTSAPMEIVAFELRSGLEHLGEITGQTTDDEVLDSIFSQFCLGK